MWMNWFLVFPADTASTICRLNSICHAQGFQVSASSQCLKMIWNSNMFSQTKSAHKGLLQRAVVTLASNGHRLIGATWQRHLRGAQTRYLLLIMRQHILRFIPFYWWMATKQVSGDDNQKSYIYIQYGYTTIFVILRMSDAEYVVKTDGLTVHPH